MYQLVPVPIIHAAKISEEEFLRAADSKPIVWRLGIAVGLIAALVLSLDIACNDNRPQTVAADEWQVPADAP